jgi:hypothetical protein
MITQTDLARDAAVAREVELTTFGRATGRPSRRTIYGAPRRARVGMSATVDAPATSDSALRFDITTVPR